MKYEIFWSKRAKNNFSKILEYLTAEWGEKSAEKYSRRTFQVLVHLKSFPFSEALEHKNNTFEAF